MTRNVGPPERPEREAAPLPPQAFEGLIRALAGSETLQDVLWAMAGEVMGSLGLEDCVIYLVDGDRGVLVQAAAFGPKDAGERTIHSPIEIPVGDGIVGWVARTCEPVLVPDVRNDPRYIVDDGSRRSELAVPILFHERVLGVIDSEHSMPGFFHRGHLEVFTTVARLAAPRIAAALLTRELQAAQRGIEHGARSLRNQQRFQEALVSLSSDLLRTTADRLDRDVNDYLGRIGELVGADRSYIFRFLAGGALMSNTHEWCRDGIEPQKAELQEVPSERFSWVVQRILREQAFLVGSLDELGEEGIREQEEFRELGIRSLVGAALRGPRGIIGFLGFDAVREEVHWSDDVRALLLVASDNLASLIHRIEAEDLIRESDRVRQSSLVAAVAGVAHELNTPIGVALTAGSILEEEVGAILAGPVGEESVDRIGRSAALVRGNLERAAELVRMFRTITVDQATDEPQAIDLAEYIRTLLGTLAPLLRSQRLTVRELFPADPVRVVLPPGRLAQVLTNLIQNASIHGYGGDGGAVEVSLEERGDRVLLALRDFGAGMTREVLARCFDPFFTTGRGRGGSGLGLFIVRQQIEAHLGGSVEVRSAPGEGTAWVILLPRDVGESGTS